MNLPKRLIEVDLPIKRISAHARREKSIRHGHISTLHIWWARRPLAACRAVICAALWPDPVDVTAEDIAEAKKQGRDLQLNTCPPAFRDKAKELMREWAKRHLGLVSAEAIRDSTLLAKTQVD
jgi:putative DNA methylase